MIGVLSVQLARSPDLLKKDNQMSISFIASRNDNLNNKASEVNSRLLHMFAERNIPYIDHTNSIQQGNRPYESKFHLNRFGKLTFAKFQSEYYWWYDDSSNIEHLVQEKRNKESKGCSQLSGKENHMIVSNPFKGRQWFWRWGVIFIGSE